jgi:hypothetical protein
LNLTAGFLPKNKNFNFLALQMMANAHFGTRLTLCARTSYRNGRNTKALIFENFKPVEIIKKSFQHHLNILKMYKFSKLEGCGSIIKPATPI